MKKSFICFICVFAAFLLCAAVSAGALRTEIPASVDGAVDLNGDGICSIKDVNMILNHIINKEKLSDEAQQKADIDGNGVINVRDATALRRIVLYKDIPVEQINLSSTDLTLYKGKTAILGTSVLPDYASVKKLTYESSNSDIAAVEQSGKITAVSVGSAEIAVTAESGVSAVCRVTVEPLPVSEITLNKSDVWLYTGSTAQLTASLKPSNADDKTVSYSSNNTSVATVSSSGTIKAKSAGTATITATAASGVKTSCLVSVYSTVVNYSAVYTSAAVKRDCAVLEKMFPELITYSSIGTSVKGNSIPLLTLGNGSRKVCVTAAIHSREILTTSFVMRCAEEYAKAYVANKTYDGYDVKSLLDRYTIYIVPVSNPDGMDIYSAGASVLYSYPKLDAERLEFKGNANGVNLNRNFPFYWSKITTGSISNRTNTNQTYKGASAASEPETQALIKLCDSNSFQWMFSMHLRGDVIYWSDTVNTVSAADRRLANALSSKCGFYLMPATNYVNGYGGGFENYFRYAYGKPGFCVELVSESVPTPTYPAYYNTVFNTATRWSSTRSIFLAALDNT